MSHNFMSSRSWCAQRRGRRPQLVVAAGGVSPLDRIRRPVGLPEPRADRSAWSVTAALAAGVLAMVATSGPGDVRADAPSRDSGEQAGARGDNWGPESRGLRCRIVAVPASTDAESPDMSKTTHAFARGDEVTFAVELENVGKEPVTLLGVRYGESYATAAGKLATDFFAPRLFEFEFTDAAGKSVPRPARVYLDEMLQLSGASAHEMTPGKSLKVLLRPAKFNAPMETKLPPGVYKARVRYRGPGEKSLAKMRKHWLHQPQGRAWAGEVASNRVAFAVAGDPGPSKPPVLKWGEPQGDLRAEVEFRDLPQARPPTEPHGTIPQDSPFDVVLHLENGGQLRAAVEFRDPRQGRPPTDPAGTIPLNSTLGVVFHLENVGDKPLSFVSETWRQDDQLIVKDEAGEEQTLGGAWYTGWPIMVRWTLRPGEVAELNAASCGVAADDKTAAKFGHPVGKTLIAKPGRYSFRYTIRLGSLLLKDDKGNVVVPGEGDWRGVLVTGEATLVVRARTPEDDVVVATDPPPPE